MNMIRYLSITILCFLQLSTVFGAESDSIITKLQTTIANLNSEDGATTVGGAFRLRYHNENNFRNTATVPNALGLTGVDDSFLLKQTRVWFDYKPSERFQLYTELIDAVSAQESHSPRPIDENRLDLHQLFIKANLTDSLIAKVGRQNITFGSNRLMSSLGWANTNRPFDGVIFEKSVENGTVKPFWLQPVAISANQADRTNHNLSHYGVYFEGKQSGDRQTDLYWFGMQNGVSGMQTDTLAGLIKGKGENWQYELEGGVQVGRNSDASNHIAGFAFAGIGRQIEHEIGGDIWFMYDWASGDSQPGNGFHQNQPLGHLYLGFMDLFGRSNLHDINIRWTRQINEKAKLLVWYHYFALANGDDTGPYNVTGTPFAGHPLSDSTSRDLGHEIDLLATIELQQQSTLTLGYSYFFAGAYYQQPGLPYDGDASFFYAQYAIRF